MKQAEEAEAKKNGSPPRKNGAVKNGNKNVKSPVPKTKNGTDTSTCKASPSLLVCSIVVLLSFTAGVWTPPFLAHPKALELRRWLFERPETCNEEALSHFLHDASVLGMHVVCLKQGESGALDMKVFAGAYGEANEISSEKSWSGVRDALKRELRLGTADALHQPWAVFSSVGERIADEETDGNDSSVVRNLLDSGLVVLFEGGQWVWPGVR